MADQHPNDRAFLVALRRSGRRVVFGVLPLLLAGLLLLPGTLRAAEATALTGALAGVELCPQAFCGSAIFVGRFDGALNGDTAEGRWWVMVNHDDLPRRGRTAPITGGLWGIVVGERPLRGVVTGGTILNNGDGTFTVKPILDLREGGEGTLAISILLDHGSFPPTVDGQVTSDTGGERTSA